MGEVSITSKGIDWLSLEVGWAKEGTKLTLRVDPRVEDFFKNLSAGNMHSIGAQGGRDWNLVNPLGEEPLQSYTIMEETFHHSMSFFMGYPSFPMYLDSFPNKINLSFLHLVGASAGKQFIVKTPISSGGRKDLRSSIERGMQEFVREYLMFGKMVIRVSSFEVS